MSDRGEKWRRLLEEQARRRMRAEALARANPQGLRFALPNRPQRKALVSLDTDEPGKWRVTWFDEAGPSGHAVYNTMVEAILSLLPAWMVSHDRA